MNKITRRLAAAATAAFIIGGTAASAQASASIQPYESDYVFQVRNHDSSGSARFYSDAAIANAGHYACSRKSAYGLGWQVGTTRTRIIQAVERDVNNNRLGGQRYGFAITIVKYTGYSKGLARSICS